MITREFKKLFNKNIVSIRDYELSNAIKAGGMIFIHKGLKMTKSAEELKEEKFQVHSQKLQSKHYPDQTYTLYDFVFVPDGKKKVAKVDSRQLSLF